MSLVHAKSFSGYVKGRFEPGSRNLILFDRDSILNSSGNQSLSKAVPVYPGSIILGIAHSPNGKLLAIANRTDLTSQTSNFRVSIVEKLSGQEVGSLPIATDLWYRNVDDLSFSPDGAILAANIGGIPRLWRTSDGSEIRRFPSPGPDWESQRVLLAPDGNKFATYFRKSTPHSENIRIWDLGSDHYYEFQTNVYRDWAFSADSKLLAVSATIKKGEPDQHAVIQVWNLLEGKLLNTIEVPKDWRGAYVVAFAPNGRDIAIGGYKRFGIFSVQDGSLLATAKHAESKFFSSNESINDLTDIEFSPDGKLLLTGGAEATVKLWEILQK